MIQDKVNWSCCKKSLVRYVHAKTVSTDTYMRQNAFKVIRGSQVSRKDFNVPTECLETDCTGPLSDVISPLKKS